VTICKLNLSSNTSTTLMMLGWFTCGATGNSPHSSLVR
jgi:hypothetical protein